MVYRIDALSSVFCLINYIHKYKGNWHFPELKLYRILFIMLYSPTIAYIYTSMSTLLYGSDATLRCDLSQSQVTWASGHGKCLYWNPPMRYEGATWVVDLRAWLTVLIDSTISLSQHTYGLYQYMPISTIDWIWIVDWPDPTAPVHSLFRPLILCFHCFLCIFGCR